MSLQSARNVLGEKRKVYTINTVVGHARPHLDEAAAIVVLRHEGLEFFPGIDQARFVEYDPAVHDLRTEQEWLESGHLFIGVGGHMFDDHPPVDYPNDCALTLALKHLGLRDDLVFDHLAKKVFAADRHPVGETWHLASLLKDFNYFDGTSGEVFEIVEKLLYRGFIPAQRQFQEALVLIHETGEKCEIWNERLGDNLLLYAVEAVGNPQVARAARSRPGFRVDMVIIRDPNLDHVYISTNFAKGLRNLSGLAAKLREMEIECNVDEEAGSDLGADGMVAGWCYQVEASAILRGSLSHVNQPGTRLDHDVVVEAAKEFLSDCRVDEKKRNNYFDRDEKRKSGQRVEEAGSPLEMNRIVRGSEESVSTDSEMSVTEALEWLTEKK